MNLKNALFIILLFFSFNTELFSQEVDSSYIEVETNYSISKLINTLKINTFKQSTFDISLLVWNDIPKLLAYGGSTLIITNFPRNPLSSYCLKECKLGIIMLWLVEAIRLNEGKSSYNPFKRYASLNPILSAKGQKTITSENNTLEFLKISYEAYKKWWSEANLIGKDKAKNINPLAETGLRWR